MGSYVSVPVCIHTVVEVGGHALDEGAKGQEGALPQLQDVAYQGDGHDLEPVTYMCGGGDGRVK